MGGEGNVHKNIHAELPFGFDNHKWSERRILLETKVASERKKKYVYVYKLLWKANSYIYWRSGWYSLNALDAYETDGNIFCLVTKTENHCAVSVDRS